MATKTVTIPCAGLDENDFELANTNFSSNFTSTNYPYSRLQDDGTSSNYARINVKKDVSSTSYVYAIFDCSNAIPRGAKITAIEGFIRLFSSGTYVTWRRVRWCLNNNNTYITNTQNYSTSSNPIGLEANLMSVVFEQAPGSTLSKLNQIKCYIEYIRSNRTDNSQRYINLYGAHIKVTYEEPVFYIKDENGWTHKANELYRKENGVWVQKDMFYLEDNNIQQLILPDTNNI